MKRLVVNVYSKFAVYGILGVILFVMVFGTLASGVKHSSGYPIWRLLLVVYSLVIFALVSLVGFGFVQVNDHDFDSIDDYPKVYWLGDKKE